MNLTTENFNAMYSDWLTPNTAVLGILLTMGTLGNSFALYLYIVRVPHTDERFFIPYLGAVDLFVCLWSGTFAIILNFYRADFPSAKLCKVMYFFSWGSINYSALLLLIIAFHRYKKICRPVSLQWTKRKSRLAVGVAGFISYLLTVPILVLFGERKGHIIYTGTNVTLITCNIMSFTREVSFYYLGFIILYFIISMTLIIILYSLIGLTIFRTFRVIRASRKVQNHITFDRGHESTISEVSNTTMEASMSTFKDVKKENQTQIKNVIRKHVRQNFTGMFAAIIVFWVISYLPTITLIIIPAVKNSIEFWFHMDPVATNVLLFLNRAFLLNHVVNPFIYGYFDVGFRKEAANLFCCHKMLAN
eukprot:XP_019928810.1 PREDICTED: neuropeptide S receptor-like [Crassostrea gigas]